MGQNYLKSFLHDPDAVLDYSVDWAKWLTDGEIIASVVWTVNPIFTIVLQGNTDSRASVWLSGGAAGSTYFCTCHIVTDAGREDDRTIRLEVYDR